VLDDEHHRQGKRGDQALEDALPPDREADGDAHQNPGQVEGQDDQGGQRA